MQKFQDLPYTRANVDEYVAKIKSANIRLADTNSLEETIKIFDEVSQIRSEFATITTIAHIRQNQDAKDEFYKAEEEYYDANSPTFGLVVTEFFKILLNHKFRKELEDKYGSYLFKQYEIANKTNSSEVLEDSAEENKLSTEYSKILATASFEVDGELHNLSSIGKLTSSSDRAIRKQAHDARLSFHSKHEKDYDNIYDQLVKVRTKIAKKLGYKNFVELAYDRMGRSDYNKDSVKKFREYVHQYIVPINLKLREERKLRLNLETLTYYDSGVDYLDGNAKPKGTSEQIVDSANKMYKELSTETGSFFEHLQKYELMDLVARENKRVGGYCTNLSTYKTSFIFSNFNGTEDDISVLTHEFGHAFQVYSCMQNTDIIDYYFPTMEACEIHSMSMEILTFPWMDNFFDNANKFKYSTLTSAIHLLVITCAIDEFQEQVYLNPEITSDDRLDIWKNLEDKYSLKVDFTGADYLLAGRSWQSIPHIFNTPFYYIDYGLAQICALQIGLKSFEDFKSTWESYFELCKLGGKFSFLELLKKSNLDSPFESKTILEVSEKLEKVLSTIKI